MRPAAETAPGPAEAAGRDLQVRTGRALGSRLRLVVAPPADRRGEAPDRPRDRSVVDSAWAAVLAEFAAVDAAMSRFRSDSEVTLLNRAGSSDGLSRRLRVALFAADRARRLTAGRFDPRVLRDMERLGFAGVPVEGGARDDVPPRDPDRTPAGRWSNRRIVACEGGMLRLSAPIDLGGIGKGLALRWAADAAERVLGARGFLLDAGGDIATRGPAPSSVGGSGWWSIAIEDPLDGQGDEPLATSALAGGLAMATSSTRVGRHETPGGAVHHLVDPGTGRPGGNGLLAVSVAWPDPAWAEVWSKSLFLAGPRAIATEARGRGLAAWWVDVDGRLSMTPAARVVTTWVRDERPRERAVSPP